MNEIQTFDGINTFSQDIVQNVSLRLGEGWHDPERNGKDVWRWTKGKATLFLEGGTIPGWLVFDYGSPVSPIAREISVSGPSGARTFIAKTGRNSICLSLRDLIEVPLGRLEIEINAPLFSCEDKRELGLMIFGVSFTSVEPEKHNTLNDLQIYSGFSEEDLALFSEFERSDNSPRMGCITDFIGTRFNVNIVWAEASKLDGHVLPAPVPADFHAEAVEWVGVLKSVRSAEKSFSVLELGAGFGTWAICSAVAARNKGISNIRVHMVEGDPRHCESAIFHFRENGFEACADNIIHAAVGAEDGMARWPKFTGPASSDGWCNRPDLDHSGDYLGRDHAEMMDVKVLSLRTLLEREPVWNLLHMDVQGHEADILLSSINEVCQKVRWIVVGTHSRKVEGDIIDLMIKRGFILENEKPCRFSWKSNMPTLEAMTTVDGVQVWRNPKRI